MLGKVPKHVQPKIKNAIHDIWMAETKAEAEKALTGTLRRFEAKYPKAMSCLEKDREKLLAFYDFPAEHRGHLRTTNPIESTFSTVRHRTRKTRNCVSANTILAMVFKLTQLAQKRWKKLKGSRLLADVVIGIEFRDGIKQVKNVNSEAA